MLALLEENPLDSFSRFALAQEQQRMGLLIEAEESYRILLVNDPNYLGTYYHMGKLLELLEDEKQALTIYKEGIDRAEAAGDLHALSELKNARQNLLIELDDQA